MRAQISKQLESFDTGGTASAIANTIGNGTVRLGSSLARGS